MKRVLIQPIVKEEKEEKLDELNQEENVDEEFEEIFRNMEEITKKPSNKRKLDTERKTKRLKVK